MLLRSQSKETALMAKSPKKPKPEKIETEPDGWDRFQRTMDKIAPPKHRPLANSEATDKPEKTEA